MLVGDGGEVGYELFGQGDGASGFFGFWWAEVEAVGVAFPGSFDAYGGWGGFEVEVCCGQCGGFSPADACGHEEGDEGLPFAWGVGEEFDALAGVEEHGFAFVVFDGQADSVGGVAVDDSSFDLQAQDG
ncbi:Uncharacterised protein [Chlamydia trachomatis]|nr:Uncharacterised protein [Chlamydia trachomatis]CRH94601.1 Uncharacterised protein [Chlamydia trachomatis]